VAYARISITLPEEVLAAADRRAKELDRPRSWVIAEALRRWDDPGVAASGGPSRVREDRRPYQVPAGLGDQRQAQLHADLALTPEQRVIEAERTATAGPPRRGRWTGLVTFDSFEDYLVWKRREVALP
jgi:predicted transcriptional regulator